MEFSLNVLLYSLFTISHNMDDFNKKYHQKIAQNSKPEGDQ